MMNVVDKYREQGGIFVFRQSKLMSLRFTGLRLAPEPLDTIFRAVAIFTPFFFLTPPTNTVLSGSARLVLVIIWSPSIFLWLPYF